MVTAGRTARSAGGASADVPSSIENVNAEWLTAVLDGGTVTDIRTERIAEDTGFSALLYRLRLVDGEVPSSVIVKLPAQSEATGAMELLGGYQRELSFYRHVAGRAPIQTPHVYVARMVKGSADFVLVLEDLRDWDNADHLAGLSLDRARLCIEQLAGLHAWSSEGGNAAALEAFPSIDTPMARDLLVPAFGPGWDIYLDKSSESVPPAVAGFVERFAEAAGQALQALTERSMLLHGDIRADNMFFDGDHCAFDEAWRHYRFAVAYLMILPVITLNGWDAMPERSRALCVNLTDRAVATIDEIDALEVFE